MKIKTLIALFALFGWLGSIAVQCQFPAELQFGSQAKVTERIRDEINRAQIYLQWKTSQDYVYVAVEQNGDENYHRETDGELEDHIARRIDSIWKQFVAGQMVRYPESLTEGNEFRFEIVCRSYYVNGVNTNDPNELSNGHERGTELYTTTTPFTLRKANGKWFIPDSAKEFTLPFEFALNVFYLPGVRWVELVKRNETYEMSELNRNGALDGNCPYGSPADLFGNGMVYLASHWINGEYLDWPGVWGKVTFWTDEDRTEGVTYDLETGKMVVRRMTMKPVGSGAMHVTLMGVEPGSERTLYESALIERLTADDGTPIQIGVADENWQVQFIVPYDHDRPAQFFVAKPTRASDRKLLSVGE